MWGLGYSGPRKWMQETQAELIASMTLTLQRMRPGDTNVETLRNVFAWIWDSQYPVGGGFSFRVRVFKYSELSGPTWLPCLLNKMPTLIKKLHEDLPGNRVKKNPSANAGDRGPCLLWEDSRCQGTTKPLSHDCWGLCVLGPAHLKPTSNVLQLLKLSTRESARCSYWDPWRALGPVLCNNRSRHNEKPMEHNLRVDPTHHKEEKAQWSKMQCSQT